MPEINSEMNNKIMQKTETVLPAEISSIVNEAKDFINNDLKYNTNSPWFKRCLAVREVKAYLKKNNRSYDGSFAKCIVFAAAISYANISFKNEHEYPTAKDAQNVQNKAVGLHKAIEGRSWLPEPAKTKEFRKGLMALNGVFPCKRKIGENNKGNTSRRIFMHDLAGCLFTMLNEIPTGIIVGVTGIMWETIDERTVRSFLTEDKKNEIITKAKKVIKDREISASHTAMAMNRLSVPISLKKSIGQGTDDKGAVVFAIESIKTIKSSGLKRDLLDQVRMVCEEHNLLVDNNIFI